MRFPTSGAIDILNLPYPVVKTPNTSSFFKNDLSDVLLTLELRPKPNRKAAVRQLHLVCFQVAGKSPMDITAQNSAVIVLSPPTNSIHDVIGLTRVWRFHFESC